MLKIIVVSLVGVALLFSVPAFAIDGQILINQSTVMAAGGFPYKITQPGSYKLSGNLVVSGDTDAIGILTDNVTIDLNGFTISGPGVCTGSGGSISCTGSSQYGISSNRNNIAVRNGLIEGFNYGVRIQGTNYKVEEVTATGNYDGIGVISANGSGLVRRNIVSFNGQDGIVASGSTVTENVANFNGRYGLNINSGVFGSNTLDSNGLSNLLNNGAGAVSQGNNSCDSSLPC